MSMVGKTVRYLGCSDDQARGYGGAGHDDPRPVLQVGAEYEVEEWDVHDWHTHVKLKGIPCTVGFNSVCFETVDALEIESALSDPSGLLDDPPVGWRTMFPVKRAEPDQGGTTKPVANADNVVIAVVDYVWVDRVIDALNATAPLGPIALARFARNEAKTKQAQSARERCLDILKQQIGRRDREAAHAEAHKAVSNLLSSIGYEDVADLFDKIGKWCA